MHDDPALSAPTISAIAEIVEHDLRDDGGLGVLRLKSQFEQFNGSVNHPAIFGDDARHAITNRQPHPDPMTPVEAREFIRELTERWFALRAQDDRETNDA
jgi:hypothetical protein